MVNKNRLDLYLISKGLVDSRHKAQRIILAGMVRDKDGRVLDKPGQQVPLDIQLDVISQPKFVSRGGDKLLKAFERFPLNVKDRVCIDAGISTGGFTDCLLQNGAKLIYGIDVGYGQVSWNIRNNPKVKLYERTNIRYLLPNDLYKEESIKASFVVADLSFISLKLVFKPIRDLMSPDFWEGVFLIKPQFEVGKEKVSKGGVVKEANFHTEAIHSFVEFININGGKINGLISSPLKGPAGNHEYLIWISNKQILDISVNNEFIKKLVKKTFN